jgi:hypothetical protein
MSRSKRLTRYTKLNKKCRINCGSCSRCELKYSKIIFKPKLSNLTAKEQFDEAKYYDLDRRGLKYAL